MTSFITTKEYKRFVEFCDSCKQEQYIGLCYGAAGVGKSVSAEHFAQWDNVGYKIHDFMRNKYSGDLPMIPELKKLDTIIYTPEVHNTPTRVRSELSDLIFAFNDLKEKAIHHERKYSCKNYVKIMKKQIEQQGLRIVSLDIPTSWQALSGEESLRNDPVTCAVITAINNMLIDLMAAISHKDWLKP